MKSITMHDCLFCAWTQHCTQWLHLNITSDVMTIFGIHYTLQTQCWNPIAVLVLCLLLSSSQCAKLWHLVVLGLTATSCPHSSVMLGCLVTVKAMMIAMKEPGINLPWSNCTRGSTLSNQDGVWMKNKASQVLITFWEWVACRLHVKSI